MSQHLVNEKALRYMEYLNRETDNRHHTLDEDEYQYALLRAGDPRAAQEHVRILFSGLPGKVSEDPVRNYKYLTVASATLTSRAAMEVGLEAERAYNISDLYIQKMDRLQTIDELKKLNEDMFNFYVKEVAALDKRKAYSKPVALCLDFIYNNLYRQISVEELAEEAGLSPSYLSTLFKKEMGISITAYIMEKKMEAARNMLKYSDYSYSEISSILAFSSQSHFTRAFKKHNGDTPKAYREKNYRIKGE
ncbi:helix-turn-helix domain-containing protein [Acutalibacter sp. JLR.KK004]|uniref:helix-turn-helix domain-containing protein n=1 Tax=Acutalibacter sp. JLR.KK004 TaxID=3112622 RepID=UPI002FF4366B